MLYYIQLLNADGSSNGSAIETSTLGIEDIEWTLNNLAADVWSFKVGGRDIDAAQLWPYGQLMAIRDISGKRIAFGRIEPWTREGTPDGQNHIGRLVNPFWYLTKLIYQQRFTYCTNLFAATPANRVYKTYTTSRVILNILFSGANQQFYSATTGQQIADSISWAISKGAPINLGAMDPSTQPFSDFHKGICCADVIKLMFRKEPDFVMDWDYTTTPFPTVHFRKTGKSLVPLTIDLTDTTRREQVQIRERPDWRRSYVNICYDQTNSQSNGTFLAIYNDLYPNPAPGGVEALFNGVDLYCDLQGYNATSASQTAVLSSLALDITNPTTWQRWMPELSAPNVASVQIYLPGSSLPPDANHAAPAITPRDEFDASGNPMVLDPTCLYEVVDGEWADWIPNVHGQRVRCTAWIRITHVDGSIHDMQHHAEPTLISVNTLGISTTFWETTTTTTAYAEPVPVGLAKAMWTSWNNLAIEGSFTNVEATAGTQVITRSNCLNFLTETPGQNGCPDWRNVNAGVQRISGSLLHGTTKVEFGAPLFVSGNELVDAIRATRYRVTTIDLAYLFGGALGGSSSNVTMARKSHARAAHCGAKNHIALTVSQATQPQAGIDPSITQDGTKGVSKWNPPSSDGHTPATGSVTIDPSLAKGSDGNWHNLVLQEFTTCEADGTNWTRIGLFSEKYKAPGQS